MSKKVYLAPETILLPVEVESAVLVGSDTGVQITVKDVQVQEFEDGFKDSGGFKDISFD